MPFARVDPRPRGQDRITVDEVEVSTGYEVEMRADRRRSAVVGRTSARRVARGADGAISGSSNPNRHVTAARVIASPRIYFYAATEAE